MRRRQFLRGAAATAALARLPTGAATTHEPYRPLGTAPVPGATEVVARGEAAFVANRTGFVSVDLTDPTDPRVLARVADIAADRKGGPLREIWDVKLAGDRDRLVLVGPALQDIDALHAIAVYDVADPAAPERVAFRETDAASHNCFATADHVYRPRTDTPHERLVVHDLDSLGPVGGWSLVDVDDAWKTAYHGLYQLHDLWVHDGLAYLAQWDAGVVVLDVTDPTDPGLVTRFGGRTAEELQQVTEGGGEAITREGLQPPGNVHAVTTDATGDLLAVGKESWDLRPTDDRGGASGIDLYDVADPAAPERLATIDPPAAADQTLDGRFTTAHNLHLADGRLYSSWYHGGIKIHDVSDPAAPDQLAWWQRPAEAKFWGTAEPGGDSFVATNMGVAPDWGDGSLYVFPDAAAPGEGPATAGPRTPTATPTATGTAASGRTPTDRLGTQTTSTAARGMSIVGALGAVGLAAWQRWRS